MSRDRFVRQQDRLLPGGSGETLYRILGVEPHGWSTVLIEDQQGRAYLVTSATGRMAPIAQADADALVARRTYRPWQGSRAWAPFARLPLIASAVGSGGLTPPGERTEPAYS